MPASDPTVLVVVAVEAEAAAVRGLVADRAAVVVAGIGRTNAAAATTEALLAAPTIGTVVSAGIAGALPGSGLEPGAAVVATRCVYAEEGLLAPEGFLGMAGLGFALGDFEGNDVPVDAGALARLRSRMTAGPIATVATCSGTDAAAAGIARRTGAVAEAMEGAAVVHAARRLGRRGVEVRTISNTTGDRPQQRWDLAGALDALGPVVAAALEAIADAAGPPAPVGRDG